MGAQVAVRCRNSIGTSLAIRTKKRRSYRRVQIKAGRAFLPSANGGIGDTEEMDPPKPITCLFCCVLSFKKPSRKAAIVIPLAHSELQSGADRLCCLLCKRRLTPGNDDTVGEESTPPNPPLRQHDHRRPPRNTNPPFTERQGNASRRF